MNLLHPIRFAYLKFRHRVRMRLIRRHRAFLQTPFKPTNRWPTVNDSSSVGTFKRISGSR